MLPFSQLGGLRARRWFWARPLGQVGPGWSLKAFGFERMRGRRCKLPVVPLGEFIIYKEIREGKARKNKLATEGRDGVFLGHARSSSEILVGTPGGVVRMTGWPGKPASQLRPEL